MLVQILTFQFAKNYGAILQAHALSSYIREDLKEKCEIIQYWPEGSDASWRIYRRGRHPKILLRNIYVFFNRSFIREAKKKNIIMAEAINELLPLTEKKYDYKEIHRNPPKADAYICGSDQVWNPHLQDFTYLFMLPVKNVKRIGYSISMGMAKLERNSSMVFPVRYT